MKNSFGHYKNNLTYEECIIITISQVTLVVLDNAFNSIYNFKWKLDI